jgi:curved DNA-binding protein
MDFKDYYATLGLAKTATEKEIKQAYRKLARKFHPDVNPGDKAAESRFKDINEANEVLSDPDKRRKYDELGANWRAYENVPPGAQGFPGGFGGFRGPGAGTYSTSEGGQYRTLSQEEVEEMLGGGGFSDFFTTFFGGGVNVGGDERRARTSRKVRAGADLEHPVQLSLEEAYHGALRRISVKYEGHTRSIDVRIPAGIKDGARVRVAGEGEPGPNGGRAGDLYLRIQVFAHARFERQGDDLTTRLDLPLTTAVLGGEAAVTTLAGTTVRLKVPPTTQNGQKFRLKGHGMPIAGKSPASGKVPGVAESEPRGDLYVVAEVQLPRSLTPEERGHYEALAQLAEQEPSKVGS